MKGHDTGSRSARGEHQSVQSFHDVSRRSDSGIFFVIGTGEKIVNDFFLPFISQDFEGAFASDAVYDAAFRKDVEGAP